MLFICYSITCNSTCLICSSVSLVSSSVVDSTRRLSYSAYSFLMYATFMVDSSATIRCFLMAASSSFTWHVLVRWRKDSESSSGLLSGSSGVDMNSKILKSPFSSFSISVSSILSYSASMNFSTIFSTTLVSTMGSDGTSTVIVFVIT